MKVLLNRQLFTQTDSDSGALTVHASVVHAFRQPGTYEGIVHRGEAVVGRFTLGVDESCETRQFNLDLTTMDRSAALRQAAEHFAVNASGHVVFWVSKGGGGYAVVVRGREPESKVLFDSRALGPGDYYTVNPLRPGAYGATNTLTKGEARLVVAYPDVDRRRRQTAAPASIRATQQGFSPESAQIQSMQGLVFHIDTPSRIRLQLLEPYEPPPGRDTGKGRRTK